MRQYDNVGVDGDADDLVDGYDLDVDVQAQVGRWFSEAADEIRIGESCWTNNWRRTHYQVS